MTAPKHPMQPIVLAGKTIRFKENAIVSWLVRKSAGRNLLNDIAAMDFSDDDQSQLAQLIGCTVSGFGDMSYASPKMVAKADRIAAKVLAAKPKGRPREHIGGRTFVQVVLDDETLDIWNDLPDDASSMVRALIRDDAELMSDGDPRAPLSQGYKRQVVLDGATLEVWLRYDRDRSAWVRHLLREAFGKGDKR